MTTNIDIIFEFNKKPEDKDGYSTIYRAIPSKENGFYQLMEWKGGIFNWITIKEVTLHELADMLKSTMEIYERSYGYSKLDQTTTSFNDFHNKNILST